MYMSRQTRKTPHFIEIIKGVFDIPKYGNIEYYNSQGNRNSTTITISTLDGDECVMFSLNNGPGNGFIEVLQIRACNLGGNVILDMLETVARRLKLMYVIIGQDASYIAMKKCRSEDIQINLAILCILSTGESWYNRRGYKQVSNEYKISPETIFDDTSLYDDEKQHNLAIIRGEQIETFLSSRQIEPTIHNVLPFKGQTVQAYFTKIHKMMKAGKYNCSKARAINYTINSLDFKRDFRYSNYTLVKHIEAKKTPSPREPLPSAAYSISLGLTKEEEEDEEDDEEDEDEEWDEPHYSEEVAKKVKIVKDVFKTSEMEIEDIGEAGHVKLLFTIFSTNGSKCARFEIDFENDLIDIFNVYACDMGGTKGIGRAHV